MAPPSRSKVAHLTSVHAAGDTRIAHKECATLARAGYDVVVIAPGERRIMPDGVRHHALPLPAHRFYRFTRTMWDVFAAARAERAAVYHFHDPELIAVGAALRLLGARVIMDVHEDVPLDIETKPWIPKPLRAPVKWAASVFLRLAQRCFTAIVPATPDIAQTFSHGRVVVVRNYPSATELLCEDGTPYLARPSTAIYAGSVTLVRGVEQMVRAMESPKLPDDAKLTLAGGFEDQMLRVQMASLPGWERVHAPGHLGRPALAAELSHSRIGLLLLLPAPSFVRSLPTKLYEYMSAALPVIASKYIDVCREVIEEHNCGLLVDEIAEAMARLFADPEGARAMGERGFAAMRERYEWSNEGRALVRLYEELAS